MLIRATLTTPVVRSTSTTPVFPSERTVFLHTFIQGSLAICFQRRTTMHSALRTSGSFPVIHNTGISIRTLFTRAITFPQTGNPHDILSLSTYTLPDTPSPNAVLVKFLAAPINPADLNQIEGVYPSKAKFQSLHGNFSPRAVGGNEGVVRILKVGDEVKQQDITPGRWAIMKYPSFGILRVF
jgi:hypothetical protein